VRHHGLNHPYRRSLWMVVFKRAESRPECQRRDLLCAKDISGHSESWALRPSSTDAVKFLALVLIAIEFSQPKRLRQDAFIQGNHLFHNAFVKHRRFCLT